MMNHPRPLFCLIGIVSLIVGLGSSASGQDPQVPQPVPAATVNAVPTDAAPAPEPAIVEPPLPTGITSDPGFFPTFQESVLLSGPMGRDPDYSRRQSGGSDLNHYAASGDFWSYETQPTPMSRLQRMLVPFDYLFQPFVPGWGYNIGQSETGFNSFDISMPMGGITRHYHPEESHAAALFGMGYTQYSPIYFDLLSVSALVAYGHGSGPGLPDGGWIAGMSADLRFVLKLTDRTSFMLNGSFYLTWDDGEGGDSGFGTYFSSSVTPMAFGTLLHQFEIGQWDITVFDMIGAYSGWDLFRDQIGDGAIADTIGASIGISEYNIDRGSWFDTDDATLYNQAGIRAGTFVNRDLRLLLGFVRNDSWFFDGFDHRDGHEQWNAGLYYNNNGWWIAPSLTWGSMSRDFQFQQHYVSLNATAPLTPNITAQGGVGYTFGDDVGDSLTWMAGLDWNMTKRLRSWIHYGQGYHTPIVGDSWLGTTLSAGARWMIGARASLAYTATWTDSDSDGSQAFTQGIGADYGIGNYTTIYGFIGHQELSSSLIDGRILVYNVELVTRLATRLTGTVGYRNTDTSYGGSEDVTAGTFYLSLTRTF